MTDQEILANAPEGATLFGADIYFKQGERAATCGGTVPCLLEYVNEPWMKTPEWSVSEPSCVLRSLDDIRRLVELSIDAQRWNALINSPFRLFGYAGLGHDDPTQPCPDHGREGHAHFGCEMWTKHTGHDASQGKDILIGFADQAITAQALAAKSNEPIAVDDLTIGETYEACDPVIGRVEPSFVTIKSINDGQIVALNLGTTQEETLSTALVFYPIEEA